MKIFRVGVSSAALIFLTATAQAAPSHPAYLHALKDLHLAYGAVESRDGDAAMKPHEQAALEHIHAAAEIIRKAATDDGKNIDYAPPADTHPGRIGKLHDARAYLEKARSDIHEAETDQAAQSLQGEALREIDAAEHSVDVAMSDYQEHK